MKKTFLRAAVVSAGAPIWALGVGAPTTWAVPGGPPVPVVPKPVAPAAPHGATVSINGQDLLRALRRDVVDCKIPVWVSRHGKRVSIECVPKRATAI
jgi:hypothetical protein